MGIQELVDAAYATAMEKGWHDRERNIGESIALMHSELSEVLEAARDRRPLTEVYRTGDSPKPEGVPVELADLVIRVFDFCGEHKIDLEHAIEEKMAYNRTRPHRHGKAF